MSLFERLEGDKNDIVWECEFRPRGISSTDTDIDNRLDKYIACLTSRIRHEVKESSRLLMRRASNNLERIGRWYPGREEDITVRYCTPSG